MGKFYRFFRIVLIGISSIVSAVFFVAAFFFLLESTSAFFEMISMLLQIKEKLGRIFDQYDFFAASIILMALVAIPQLITTLMILARMKRGIIYSIISSFLLMVVSIPLIIWFPDNRFTYMILITGASEELFSILCYIAYYQNHFYFNEDNYLRIGLNPETLVVCHSTDVYMKKLAYEVADEMEADLYEIDQNKSNWFKGALDSAYEFNQDIDIKEYRNIHFVLRYKLDKIPQAIIDFIENHPLKNKRVYFEIVTSKTRSLNKFKDEIKYYVRHANGFYITKMRFGVISERIKKN